MTHEEELREEGVGGLDEPTLEPDLEGPGAAAAVDDEYDEYDEYDEEEGEADPVVGWLIRIAAALVIVMLGAALGLIMFIMSMRGAPRTEVDRTIAAAEEQVKAVPKDSKSWARLAYAYAEANRFSDGLAAIANGRKAGAAAVLDLAEADLLHLSGRNQEALKAYDVAEKSEKAEFKKRQEMLKARDVTMNDPDVQLGLVYLGRGQTLDALGRFEESITALKAASVIAPTDSDLLVEMGSVYAKLGRKQDAVASYNQAMTFVPDYPPAVAGLKRLNEGK